MSRIAQARPYVQRLLQDEYVQDQIGEAISGVRRSAARAQGRSAGEALEDPRLRAQLSSTVGSLTEAARRLGRPPEPPKRHRLRGGLLLGLAVAAGWGWTRRSHAPTTNQG
jgi:hypothetical protein